MQASAACRSAGRSRGRRCRRHRSRATVRDAVGRPARAEQVKFGAPAPPSPAGRAQGAFAEGRGEAHPGGTAALAELVEIESAVMLNWTRSLLNVRWRI